MDDQKERFFQLYRKTKLGQLFVETIDELIESKQLLADARDEYLKCFDISMCRAFYLAEPINMECRRQMTGRHVNHNHCNSIWTFALKDTNVQLSGTNLMSKMLQVIAIEGELNPYVDLDGAGNLLSETKEETN
jgi:hypothetical protein